jgi:acyl-CoA synthetase (AMP-forming)/AMP-acid ligase II
MDLSHVRGDTGVPLIGETIGARLRAVTALFGDHVALPGTTYAELWREVDRAARALVALGVHVGDRVAVPEEDLVAAYGTLRAGGIVVFGEERRAGVTVRVAGADASARGETVRDFLDEADRISPVELLTRELHFHPDDAAVIRRGAVYSHRALVNRSADSILGVFADRGMAVYGRVPPNVEVKLIDAGGVVPRGVPGELCTRGYHVMLGYWNDPVATRAAIDEDAWLHTGEIAVMDADGYVRPASLARAA